MTRPFAALAAATTASLALLVFGAWGWWQLYRIEAGHRDLNHTDQEN